MFSKKEKNFLPTYPKFFQVVTRTTDIFLFGQGIMFYFCLPAAETMLFHKEQCDVWDYNNIHTCQVLRDAETMLRRMEHRGACGCDNDSGDGAGVMTGIPHKLYTKVLK